MKMNFLVTSTLLYERLDQFTVYFSLNDQQIPYHTLICNMLFR